MQVPPPAQSELEAQAVKQPVPPALQASPLGHCAADPAEQLPEPLQVPPVVNVLPVQAAAPQEVVAEGKTHAPAASQSVAPHAAPVAPQAAAQQRVPAPLGPQRPLLHASLAAHALPAAARETHVPVVGPGFEQNSELLAQSPSAEQWVRHAVPLPQASPPAQGAGVPGAHPPWPLQVPAGVNVLPEHDARLHEGVG